MRRVILATVMLGLVGLPTAVQAESWYSPRQPTHVYYAKPLHCPYGYTSFGRCLRGGYGRNGYAPVFGPVWGPQAYMPAVGKGVDLRPNGSYVRSLGLPEGMFGPETELAEPDGLALPPNPN